jgi:hypothetical protein
VARADSVAAIVLPSSDSDVVDVANTSMYMHCCLFASRIQVYQLPTYYVESVRCPLLRRVALYVQLAVNQPIARCINKPYYEVDSISWLQCK